MTAKGKINATNVQTGDRIIVQTNARVFNTITDEWETGTTFSQTKTGEGVIIGRVTGKVFREAQGRYERRGKYVIETTAGTFEAAPIQTMWLAPEDAAGVKRAHVEALAENKDRLRNTDEEAAELATQLPEAERIGQAAQAARNAETEEQAAEIISQAMGLPIEAGRVWAASNWSLTLHSQDGKVDSDSEEDQPEGETMTATTEIDLETLPDPDGSNSLPIPAGPWGFGEEPETTETDEPAAPVKEATGSAVVRLLEKVWARIREDHPELPDVVIVTGSGAITGGLKWGHFREGGWSVRTEAEAVALAAKLNEMFMAGETLAKGAKQVLQTMLHEGAHLLACIREEKDTSRQNRWHNKVFLKLAEEMGLEYRHAKADSKIGYSAVVLTDETIERYADLLEELDREIHLVVGLPGWLGGVLGGGQDGDDETAGGENVRGGQTEGGSSTNNTKLTCKCEEPNIIRASKKVANKLVVRCDDCQHLFRDRS